MKKSEFKKLKIGDVVRLRTLDEMKKLKCCVFGAYGEISFEGDDGYIRSLPSSVGGYLFGVKVVVVERYNEDIIRVEYKGGSRHLVVRQHLKGSK